MKDWLEYNQSYRPGAALFVKGTAKKSSWACPWCVTGECKQTGYLSKERCDKISERLKNENN